jgi:hypothetical protein
LLPRSRSGEWISKAIDEDEDVDDDLTFSSARLPANLARASPFRTDCPSLIQERVIADHELRIYWLLGNTFALKLMAADDDYVDIRLLPHESLTVERTDIESNLATLLHGYCNRRRLSYCVFDFLVAAGRCSLIDATPSGTWSHYESADDRTVTRWYAGIIADRAHHLIEMQAEHRRA